jgi:hypothetical protein
LGGDLGAPLARAEVVALLPRSASFGQYVLDEQIGQGGMAQIWRARNFGPGGWEKELVLKTLLPRLARQPR